MAVPTTEKPKRTRKPKAPEVDPENFSRSKVATDQLAVNVAMPLALYTIVSVPEVTLFAPPR